MSTYSIHLTRPPTPSSPIEPMTPAEPFRRTGTYISEVKNAKPGPRPRHRPRSQEPRSLGTRGWVVHSSSVRPRLDFAGRFWLVLVSQNPVVAPGDGDGVRNGFNLASLAIYNPVLFFSLCFIILLSHHKRNPVSGLVVETKRPIGGP